MFFRKKKTPKLVDIVPKVTHTDYVFNNIMGDLGHACDDIGGSSPLMVMAYAYARRTAAAAMYIQGMYDRDTFAYVQSMFVNFQYKTDGSVEFQEAAAAESDDFMQTYSPQINGLLTKGIITIARDYDVSGNHLDDADLFKEVIDTIYQAQMDAASASAFRDSHASSMRVIESALNASTDKPNSVPRLIDFVEKVSSSKFGAFANMCDDIKASSEKFVGRDPLFAAAGYATLLGRCAVFVGGGVTPKIIVDAVDQSNVLMADLEGNQEALSICKKQAVDLASTYVRKLTPEAADVLLEMGLKFERFVDDDKERITPDEVVLRAGRIARDKEI